MSDLTFDISNRDKTINLGAGPSSLPTDVLVEAAQGIVDYQGSGMGLVELSHRSGTFKKVVEGAEADLRALLDIPDDYAVLFVQGGGTEQFSATALNLLAHHAIQNPSYVKEKGKGPPCDYAVTGAWTAKAIKESQRLGFDARAVVDSRKLEGANGKFGAIPPAKEWKLSDVSEKPAFLYYCDNETVDGVEYASPGFPLADLPKEYRETVPIVADCSSNILSRPIDIRAHSIVFFGAQKNVGPSGVTVVIVRRSIIERDPDEGVPNGGPRIPVTLVYKFAADNDSLYNTPPMFAIYVSALVFSDLLRKKGGVKGATERSAAKSKTIYSLIEASGGVFQPTVRQPDVRSRMNVTFRVCGSDGQPSTELEERFVKRCAEAGIQQVKGHRSVGGIRTSLYNAVSVEQVQVLADVMRAFIDEVKK